MRSPKSIIIASQIDRETVHSFIHSPSTKNTVLTPRSRRRRPLPGKLALFANLAAAALANLAATLLGANATAVTAALGKEHFLVQFALVYKIAVAVVLGRLQQPRRRPVRAVLRGPPGVLVAAGVHEFAKGVGIDIHFGQDGRFGVGRFGNVAEQVGADELGIHELAGGGVEGFPVLVHPVLVLVVVVIGIIGCGGGGRKGGAGGRQRRFVAGLGLAGGGCLGLGRLVLGLGLLGLLLGQLLLLLLVQQQLLLLGGGERDAALLFRLGGGGGLGGRRRHADIGRHRFRMLGRRHDKGGVKVGGGGGRGAMRLTAAFRVVVVDDVGGFKGFVVQMRRLLLVVVVDDGVVAPRAALRRSQKRNTTAVGGNHQGRRLQLVRRRFGIDVVAGKQGIGVDAANGILAVPCGGCCRGASRCS